MTIPQPKAAVKLASTLREQIVRGQLAEGTALAVEEDLIRQTKYSRFTVREALRLLEEEGLLEIRRGVGGGPKVRHPSIARAAQAVGVQLQLHDVPVLDAWQARNDLVLAAVDDLAAHGGLSDAVRLNDLVDQLANFANFEEFYQRWITLTDEIVHLAGNTTRFVLIQALREITEAQLHAATLAADPDGAEAFRRFVIASCRDTVGAIGAHDGHTARRLFQEQTDLQAKGHALLLGPATVVDIFPKARRLRANPSQPDRSARTLRLT